MLGPDGVAGESHSLEQQGRAALHQVLVDVRAGVALVTVGDDELLIPLGRAGERPLPAGGKARAAPSADLRLLDLMQELLGSQLGERPLEAGPVAGARQHGLVEDRTPVGLRGLRARPRQDTVDYPGARVDHLAVANRRGGMAETQADGLGERDRSVVAALAQLEPEPVADPVDVLVAGGGEAGRPGADADVACAPRLQEVVVESGDAVDRRLREAGALRGLTAIGVRDLTVALERFLQHLERGGSGLAVVTSYELDQVLGQGF